MRLTNDDYLFSEIRNKHIAVIPQALQNKLYEMQSARLEGLRCSGDLDQPEETPFERRFVRSAADPSGSFILRGVGRRSRI